MVPMICQLSSYLVALRTTKAFVPALLRCSACNLIMNIPKWICSRPESNVDILFALQYFYCLNKVLLLGQGFLAFLLIVLAVFLGLQLTLGPLWLLEEYEDHLRRNHEDFQPLPRIFTKAIFTHEEPRVLYRHYQLEPNQAPIRMDKSNAWRTVTKTLKFQQQKKQSKPCEEYNQKLIELEEKFDRLKQKVHTIIEKEIQPADLEDSISSLAKRLDNFSISGLQHIHLGIFMIRLHALHQRSAGTNALVVLRDTRWEDSRQIIGTMEVDLSTGTQLVYMFPDMVLSIDDFHNHVEVSIQTHGYDTWQGGESNLLVTMAMIGRLSNTSYMGFQYSVDNVVDHLTTTGITAIPGERRSVEELEGMSWNLRPSEQTSGDEFSDKEATPGKVMIIDKKEEWDDDERSGGKILGQRSIHRQDRTHNQLINQTISFVVLKEEAILLTEDTASVWSDVISRWESITINRLNSQTYNKAKLAFVENLLGESEKLMWQKWQTAYPGEYAALETITDDPQNITSQVRQLIIMEDPYRGLTDEQDRAYRDLDRITYEETNNLWSFLEDF
ncbi:hypothetical protein Tco_1164128 [Tanacetum coccineum]